MKEPNQKWPLSLAVRGVEKAHGSLGDVQHLKRQQWDFKVFQIKIAALENEFAVTCCGARLERCRHPMRALEAQDGTSVRVLS